MIDTLFFALQSIGIVVIIGWAVINDRLPFGRPSRGPLAYKEGGTPPADKAQAGRERRGLTRRRVRSNLVRLPL